MINSDKQLLTSLYKDWNGDTVDIKKLIGNATNQLEFNKENTLDKAD